MKKSMISSLAIIAALGISSGISSSLAAPVELKVNLRVGNAALELGKIYKSAGGTDYQVDLLKFYVSNVALVKADGSIVSVPGLSLAEFKGMGAMGNMNMNPGQKSPEGMMDAGQMYAAKTTQDETIFKLDIPAGDYRGVRFEIGVPRDLNNQDASLQKLPLGLDVGMFWAWNPGYIFYRFEGKTMVQGKPQPFLLHMGTDANRMAVNLFDLQTNKIKITVPEAGAAVKINLDVSKVFECGPTGGAWDLTNPALRVMHGGLNANFAYINLLGAWSVAQ